MKFSNTCVGLTLILSVIVVVALSLFYGWWGVHEDEPEFPEIDYGLLKAYVSEDNQILVHPDGSTEPTFKFEVLQQEVNSENATVWLKVRSINFLTHQDTPNYYWEHQVVIFFPEGLNVTDFDYTRAVILTDGSSRLTNLVDPSDDISMQTIWNVAKQTHKLGIWISRIPPRIEYYDLQDHTTHSENDLMAIMWHRWIFQTQSENYDLDDSFFAPMVKAAKKCVDAVELFLRERDLMELGFCKNGQNQDTQGNLISTHFLKILSHIRHSRAKFYNHRRLQARLDCLAFSRRGSSSFGLRSSSHVTS